ncbi:CopD family protein [Pandoraea terrigena]|uniref:Membrane protein n=1 Tax=Pandoraea terrigena TaxID=2508292 RepID=A0A5E4U494_9BURK|nr:CopD family protein [Pandoraea terrigena]VVD94551.1 membrane protein [Pandoraea terrigena]
MNVYALSLFLHLVSVAVWIGGMFFALACLRPASSELSPQQRLPLWEAALSRFFTWVGVAIVMILLSGGHMMLAMGGLHARWPVHAMAGIGVVMMLVFGHIRFALFPRLQRAVQAQSWPDGAAAVNGIRRLVILNLALGVVVIGLASSLRG